MSLKGLWVLVTLAAVLLGAGRMAIRDVEYKAWLPMCVAMSVFGFLTGAALLLRRFRKADQQALVDLAIWTVLPGVASTIGWLPSKSVTKVLPLLVVGSLFVVLIAAIGANKEWERDADL